MLEAVKYKSVVVTEENSPFASVTDDVDPTDIELVQCQRQYTYSPSVPNNSPSVLTFTDIVVSTKKYPSKTLLNNISGSITGGFWAILGASGSGKTTLLSTLSLRLDPQQMTIAGEIRLNGREYSRTMLKSMSA
jgi:ABC-type bacteriocin/lantibiotic exporter with double-glycine peptidase domain